MRNVEYTYTFHNPAGASRPNSQISKLAMDQSLRVAWHTGMVVEN